MQLLYLQYYRGRRGHRLPKHMLDRRRDSWKGNQRVKGVGVRVDCSHGSSMHTKAGIISSRIERRRLILSIETDLRLLFWLAGPLMYTRIPVAFRIKTFRRDYYIGARKCIDARRSNHERSSTRIFSLPPSEYIEMRIRSCAVER